MAFARAALGRRRLQQRVGNVVVPARGRIALGFLRDGRDLGNHVAGSLHEDAIPRRGAEGQHVILVVERRMAHGDSEDLHGVDVRPRVKRPFTPTWISMARSTVVASTGANL